MVEAVISAVDMQAIPVTILTGFLGAGKTTLLSSLLRHPGMARTAVIINEFGDVGLDHDLVRANTDGEILLLESGCVCCSLRSDLIDTLRDLYRQRVMGKIPEFDRVIVETTGLADPVPLLSVLAIDPLIAARYMLEGVVTVIDAVGGDATMDVHAESVSQAAVADRLILSKTDLATPEAIARITARLAALVPQVTPVAARRGDIDPSLVFGANTPRPAEDHHNHDHGHDEHAHEHDHAHHDHDHGIASVGMTWSVPLSGEATLDAIEAFVEGWGDHILRIKGILSLQGEPQSLVLQGVGHLLYPLEPLAGNDGKSRIVVIARDLPAADIRAAFAKLGPPD